MNIQDSIITDEVLAIRVQQGDATVFGDIVDRYTAKLERYGRKFLRDPENITDLLQDIFIKVYENIQSFDATQKFSPWIYRIAHNAFVNELRKHSRSPIINFDFDTLLSYQVSGGESPVKDRETEEEKLMVSQGLEMLPPKYREVIVLHFLEEMSYKEIADVLHIPIGTVGIRLARAKKMMHQAYKKLGITYEQ